MEKKELEITFSGQAGCGKSTMMHEFYKFLWINGFDVNLNLEGNFDYKDEKDFRKKLSNNQEERLKSMKKDIKITLKSKQMKRECKETNYEGQD